MSIPDSVIVEFDRALRTVLGEPQSRRTNPAEAVSEERLDDGQRRRGAALMRVNHCGEVCAQALYQGQALASSSLEIQTALTRAASEETDHLAWSAQRIRELGGYAAGKVGDRWNLGFLAETERQVESHLQGHLDRLGERDAKTRAVIRAMQQEEAGHRKTAEALGASELPPPVRQAMRWAAKLMTTTSYWI